MSPMPSLSGLAAVPQAGLAKCPCTMPEDGDAIDRLREQLDLADCEDDGLFPGLSF